MKGRADFVFEIEEAEKIYQALLPETLDEIHRSKISLSYKEERINLRIEGDDLASLRSALNTWIRLIKIAYEMVNI